MRMSLITSVLTISLVVPRDIFHGLAHEREIMFEMDAVECEDFSEKLILVILLLKLAKI